MSGAIRTAVVGCGSISDIYLNNLKNKYSSVELVSCCALHIEHAKEKAKKYGIAVATYDDILKDKTIQMIVILTPAPTHYELIRQALCAGKHVFTEKPITMNLEEVRELADLANSKHLYLGAAPDTFLGSRFQTAYRAIQNGMIGKVTSFAISGNRDLDLFASVYRYMREPGGGICFDYGVYYLTALVSLLGPVEKVMGFVGNKNKERVDIFPESPDYGKTFRFENESYVSAVLQMKSGVTGTFCMNGDSNMEDLGVFIIYGTNGILKLGNADLYGDNVVYIPNDHNVETWGQDKSKILKNVSYFSDNCRGIGPAEMAWAVMKGKRSRVDKYLSLHVLDIVLQIMKSSETGKCEKVESICEKPEVLDNWNEFVI